MAERVRPYAFDWHRILTEDGPHIEFCIADICDCNCRGCSHLAPLARQPGFIDEDDFVRVADILSRVVPDAHTVWLTGGEPTLHPGYLRLLRILAEKFAGSNVGIYSNGRSLLSKEKDVEPWRTTREKNIVWAITPYDIGKERFETLFDLHGCGNALTIVQSGKTFMKLTCYSHDQNISQDKYKTCGWERSKINVRHGKIYNCPSSEFADLYALYFNVKLPVTDADSLVVDDYLTRERLDKFRGPMPFCAYCDISHRREIFPNVRSERKRSEWSVT